MKATSIGCAASVVLCLVGCNDLASNAVGTRLSEVPSDGTPAATALAVCGRHPAPRGLEAWRRGLSADDVLKVTGVATDANGNAFASRAAGETFKFTEGGSVVWSRPFGSLVAVDAAGDAVVAGTFTGTLELGARTLESAGGTDAYVAKLDSSGNVLYGLALGGAEDDGVAGLAVDSQGSAIVSGSGLGTIKLDSAGRTVWTKSFFGPVAVDSVDSVLVTGALRGARSFGGDVLESAGGEDAFVAKLDGAGNHLFSVRFGDAGQIQHGEGIAVDPSDNVLVSGVMDGTVDFGGGKLSVPEGTCPSETWCKQAGFILKLDPSGHHVFSRSRAPVRSLSGIASDSRGNVFVSGAYPGDAPPYRTLLLLEFDADGADLGIGARLEPSLTESGVGHALAVDRCDNVLWGVSIPVPPIGDPASGPGGGPTERSFLTKLSP
jgi:hypothetical protein